jgi:hypothetical protein
LLSRAPQRLRHITVLAKRVFTLGTATAVLVASLTTLPAAPVVAATTLPSWSPVSEISTGNKSAGTLQIAVDPTGLATAIWRIYNGSKDIIQASTSQNGGEWTDIVPISNLTDANSSPAIVVNDFGLVTAVWQSESIFSTTSVIQYSTSQSGGEWTAPTALSSVGGASRNPQIAVDANGRATAVWSGHNGSNYVIQARSSLNGAAWDDSYTISKPGQTSLNPQVAGNQAGLTTAVWTSNYGSTTEIQTSTSQSGGTWSATPTTISNPAQRSSSPQITVGLNGRATAVWSSDNGTGNVIQTSTSLRNGPWDATTTTISDPTLYSDSPQVTADPNGRTTAVWFTEVAGTDRTVIQSSNSQNGVWPDQPVPISDPSQSSDDPRIIADSNGLATAIWSTSVASSTVIQTRAAQSGGTWSDTVTISGTDQSSSSPDIAVEATSHATVLWTARTGNENFIQSKKTMDAFRTTTAPTITGTVKVGHTLAAHMSRWWTWSPAPTSLTYAWSEFGSDAILGSEETYTLTAGDSGKHIVVTVTAERAGYASTEVTSASTAAVAPGAFETTPTPTISGTAQVGQLLTANVGTWPADTTFAYAWRQIGSDTVLATANTYTPASTDQGKYLTVAVTASLTGYYDAVATSAPSAVVAVGAFGTPVAPTMTGTAQVGQELRVNTGVWASGATFTYLWKRSGTTTVGSAEKYTPVAADIGKTLSVTVTATRAGFTTLTTPAAVTAAVLGKPFTTAPTPTVTGRTTTGSTLTAVTGAWAPSRSVVFTYVWKRATGVDGTPAPIARATSKTYKLVAADKGKYVSVTVTASLAGYARTSRTSAATLMAN